jgi:hypothetical protein
MSRKGVRRTQEEAENDLKGLNIEFKPFKYVNSNQIITIKCKQCGEWHDVQYNSVFWTNLLCHKCANKITRKSLTSTQEDVEKKLTELGIKYDSFVYKNTETKIPCYCIECGAKKRTSFGSLKNGKDLHCKKCSSIKNSPYERYTQKSIEEKITAVGIRYLPFNFNTINQKIQCYCNHCGRLHLKSISHIIYRKSINCKQCQNKSAFQERVRLYLNSINIRFEYNWREFDWLKNKFNLELDFYLPDYNTAIECQGRQHFEAVTRFGGESGFKKTQERDSLKKRLCEEHGIKLFYINYDDDVEEKMREILDHLKVSCTLLTVHSSTTVFA